MSKNNHPPLLIREQFEAMFLGLTDVERGKLLSAIMAYQWHDEEKKLPDKLAGMFMAMRSFLDNDNAKYVEKSEKNRKNIQEYWDRKRGTE